MSVREKDDPSLFYKIQEQNLLRQYDLLSNCIEVGLKKDIEAFDKYTFVGAELRSSFQHLPIRWPLSGGADSGRKPCSTTFQPCACSHGCIFLSHT